MDFSPPVFYDYKNVYNSSVSPSTVHVKNTYLSRFFQKYLLQRAISVFKWDLPKDWARDYFLYVLYCLGSIAVINTDKFGVIPQQCGLKGYDVFYRPSHVVITNPLISKTLEPRIGIECTLIKLQPDYTGIMDLVSYYSDMLALCAESCGTNMLNTKLAYVFASKNQAAATSFQKMMDKISSGEPAVFVDKNLFNDDGSVAWNQFNNNVSQAFITDKLQDAWRTYLNMFDTEIGIPNANTDKKERLVTDEVNANNVEVSTRCELILDTVKTGLKEANEMFGLNLSVDWRVKPDTVKGGGTDTKLSDD